MNIKTLTILGLLFIALGTVAVFDPLGWKTKQEEGKEKAEKVFWLKDKKIAAFEIQGKKKLPNIKISCEISSGCEFDSQGKWKILSPVVAGGDSTNIGSFLSAFKNVSIVEQTEIEANADLSTYGLNEPEKEVRIFFTGDKEPLLVRWGGKSAIGANQYLSSSFSPGKLFLVATYFSEVTKTDPLHWRNKRIFPQITPDDAETVELEYNQKIRLRAEKKNGIWQLTSPVNARANDAMVGGLLGNILYLQAHNILGESQSEVGIERILRGLKPLMKLSFTTRTNEKKHISFYKKTIGDPKQAKVEVVSVGGDVPWVGTVDAAPIGRYDQPIFEYRDKKLLRFSEKADVQKQILLFPKEKKAMVLLMDKGEWKWDPAQDLPDTKYSAPKLPSGFSAPRAQSFLDALEVLTAKSLEQGSLNGLADLEWRGLNAAGKIVKTIRFQLRGRDKVYADGELPGEQLVFIGEFLKALPVRSQDFDLSQNKQVVANPAKEDKRNLEYHDPDFDPRSQSGHHPGDGHDHH